MPLSLFSNKSPFIGKVIANMSWLFFDKILRMAVGLLIVMWLARYLGPEQFGQLNFVIALVSVFTVFSAMGLKGIVVRDLLNSPQEYKPILGTSFFLKFSAALLAYILLIITIFIIKPDDTLSKTLVAILGLSMLFKSSEVVSFWFESQVHSKYVVWVESAVFILIAIVKVVMLWQQADLVLFIWIILLESVIVSVALLILYARVEINPYKWEVNKERASTLIKDCWPLIISSAAWIIYTRIDQIMIGEMLNDQAVGYYSAAIRLSEMVNIIPMIIAFSIIPALTPLRKTNPELYNHRFQMTYDVVVGIMMFGAVITMFLSGWIIHILFGDEYSASSTVLNIHIWSAIFIAMATVSGKYLINEGLQKVTMQRHLLGVIINIPLNYVVIPLYGIEGAACASLFSLVFSNYIYDALTPATRMCFIHKTRSFVAYGLIQNLRHKNDAKN